MIEDARQDALEKPEDAPEASRREAVTPQQYYSLAEEHLRAGRYLEAAAYASLAAAGVALASLPKQRQLYAGAHKPAVREWCKECQSPRSRYKTGPDGKARPCSCRQPSPTPRVRPCRYCQENVQWDAEAMGWVNGSGSAGCSEGPDPSVPESEPVEPDWNKPGEWAEFLQHMSGSAPNSADGWWTAEELVSDRSSFGPTMPVTRFGEFPTARQLDRWLSNREKSAFGGYEVRSMGAEGEPRLWKSEAVVVPSQTQS